MCIKKTVLILSILVILLLPSPAQGDNSYLDKSVMDKGIVKLNYQSDKTVAVRVSRGEISYDYIMRNGNNNIPLQLGSGEYIIRVLEHLDGNKYRQVAQKTVNSNPADVKAVYLQSIQMINWDKEMMAVKKAGQLTEGMENDGDKVRAIYNYIVGNIAYDHAKAQSVGAGYLPVVDEILKIKRGICYDYASLFAVMLRSQGIPTKLLMGRKSDVQEYHAWNEVFLKEEGKWVTIDTTYDAGMRTVGVQAFMIKNNNDYTIEKVY
ncbi:MAG: transglutaminase domain-containing protein [Clostridia bacterium]|nr:transglutaminase domain-containing protein [Clostridia bacterium]